MRIGEDSMFVGEDGMQQVILKVNAREWLAILPFDGKVLLVLRM